MRKILLNDEQTKFLIDTINELKNKNKNVNKEIESIFNSRFPLFKKKISYSTLTRIYRNG
jgi:hypothetical protein